MKFSPEQRAQIQAKAVGKVVHSLEWDEETEFWVMTFEGGLEIAFRLKAELT